MSLAFIIYLAGVISSLSTFTGILFGASIVMYALYSIVYVINDGEIDSKFRSWPIYLIISLGLVSSLLPSERTMWMMAGAYTGQQIVESTIGKQTVELIELKLAEELDVLKGKAK